MEYRCLVRGTPQITSGPLKQDQGDGVHGHVGVEEIPEQARGSVLRQDWWKWMLSRLPIVENNLLSGEGDEGGLRGDGKRVHGIFLD